MHLDFSAAQARRWSCAALLLGAALAVGGCAAPAVEPIPLDEPAAGTPLYNGRPMMPVDAGHALPPDQFALMVRLRLIPVEVPLGTVSRSERLWSYLDEEIAGVQTGLALNRNGLRVGRGRLDEWAPFGRLLREMTGKAVERTNVLAGPGKPVPITLRKGLDVQRIFVFNERGELSGQDFPPGDNLLMMACHLSGEDPSNVLVQVSPVVRTSRSHPQYVETDAGYRFESRPATLPLEGLEFLAEVPRGYFLVIGPGPMISRESSPGHQFLVKTKEGLRFETLLVAIPEVFALRQSPAPADDGDRPGE